MLNPTRRRCAITRPRSTGMRYAVAWSGALLLAAGLCQSVRAAGPGELVAPAPASLPLSVALAAKHADFGTETVASEARDIADWVVDAGDNHAMPFIVIDKAAARAYVFDLHGKLSGAANVLLGLGRGDDTVPGIGNRKLSTIRPEERTTPAGRFIASLDRNLHGEEILWIDYDAAISLHRVITTNPKEHRSARLASTSLLDKRISFGCINVPAAFYDRFISPTFKRTSGVVYVLPETRPARALFGAYDVDEQARLRIAKAALATTH